MLPSLTRPIYRTRQVLNALRPSLTGLDSELPSRFLTPAQRTLFLAMELRDQRHVLEVAGHLVRQGQENVDLIAAALLHDCAKLGVPVWIRVARVAAPAMLARMAREGDGWRGTAYRLVNDAELSARLAQQAGASELTLSLIRGKETDANRAYLRMLQAADDAS